MIFPPTGHLLTTILAVGYITVLVVVFVGISRFCFAVLTVSASSTLPRTVVGMILPSGISVSLCYSAALGTFGFVAVRASCRYRQRKNGHDHHDRQDQTQEFTEILFQGGFSPFLECEKENASSELRRSR